MKKDLCLKRFLLDKRRFADVINGFIGGEEWDGAMRLHELIDFTDIPSKLKALISDYPIHILEIQKLTDTSMFQTDVKQVFDAIRFSKEPDKFKELIKTDPAFRALDIEAYDVIMQYTRAKEFEEIKEKVIGEEKVDMCKALTLLLEDERTQGKKEGKEEGIKEGKEEGIKEGETRACLASVKNLMANLNLTLEQTMEMLGVEPEMRTVCRNRLK